jgi:hypothetical protein
MGTHPPPSSRNPFRIAGAYGQQKLAAAVACRHEAQERDAIAPTTGDLHRDGSMQFPAEAADDPAHVFPDESVPIGAMPAEARRSGAVFLVPAAAAPVSREDAPR